MIKKQWNAPQLVSLNNNQVQSANMQTMAVYEAVYFTLQNTCVSANGAGCTTGDGVVYYTSNPSGISSNTDMVCLNAAGTNFGLSQAPPGCPNGTFTFGSAFGNVNIGDISTCTPGIQCS